MAVRPRSPIAVVCTNAVLTWYSTAFAAAAAARVRRHPDAPVSRTVRRAVPGALPTLCGHRIRTGIR
jgi:3-hydroxyisobutyrate dehydrogenase-like beta-hydroxyacid dehydrogenase